MQRDQNTVIMGDRVSLVDSIYDNEYGEFSKIYLGQVISLHQVGSKVTSITINSKTGWGNLVLCWNKSKSKWYQKLERSKQFIVEPNFSPRMIQ